jgi:hypothetical protein
MQQNPGPTPRPAEVPPISDPPPPEAPIEDPTPLQPPAVEPGETARGSSP